MTGSRVNIYKSLLAEAAIARDDGPEAITRFVEQVRNTVCPEAYPAKPATVTAENVVRFAERAIHGDICVRVQQGEPSAEHDFAVVLGPIVRRTVRTGIRRQGIFNGRERVSEIEGSVMRRTLEFVRSEKFENHVGRSTFLGVLNSVIRNRFLEFIKRCQVQRKAKECMQGHAVAKPADTEFTGGISIEVDEIIDRARLALSWTGYRVLVIKRQYPEESFAWIAEQIGESRTTVKNTWNREVVPFFREYWGYDEH